MTHGECSSSSESPTVLSTEQPEEEDARMEDDDSANTSSADEDDCLRNRVALPDAYPARDEMLPPTTGNPQAAAPRRTPLSPLSNETGV